MKKQLFISVEKVDSLHVKTESSEKCSKCMYTHTRYWFSLSIYYLYVYYIIYKINNIYIFREYHSENLMKAVYPNPRKNTHKQNFTYNLYCVIIIYNL